MLGYSLLNILWVTWVGGKDSTYFKEALWLRGLLKDSNGNKYPSQCESPKGLPRPNTLSFQHTNSGYRRQLKIFRVKWFETQKVPLRSSNKKKKWPPTSYKGFSASGPGFSIRGEGEGCPSLRCRSGVFKDHKVKF